MGIYNFRGTSASDAERAEADTAPGVVKMDGSSAAGQMGGPQERLDSGADDTPPGGVGLQDGRQNGLQLLPAERADGQVIKGAEELVELLMVGPAEMVLCRDLEFRTVRDTISHMLIRTG